MLAPIVLFTYKRLDTLKKTIEALQQNYLASESQLIIFADAAKGEHDRSQVAEVKTYLKTISGFKQVVIHEQEINKGLAKSIIEGVTKVFENHNAAIVLEDDLVTTPNFLDYMNQAIQRYESEKTVFSISGYSFNLNITNDPNLQSYFLTRGWSWGWATWRDRWQKVDWDIKDYDKFTKDKKAQKEFSRGGSDLNAMLAKQMIGKLDSWAIRWFYNQYKCKGLTLYPVLSKVFNEGFDNRATHTKGSNRRYIPVMDNLSYRDFIFPEKVEVTISAQKQFQKKMGVISRIRSKIETLLGL